MFIMYLSTFDSLQADAADLLRPLPLRRRVRRAEARAAHPGATRIAEIPGRRTRATRASSWMSRSTCPGSTEPATGRLIGIPIPHEPMLNDLFLRRGRFPAPGRPDEVLVSEAFALSRSLGPGDRVGAIINGRRRELRDRRHRAVARVRLQHPPGRAHPRRLALRHLLDGRTRRWRPPSTWKAASTTCR